jgi:hypothetical protein
MCQPAAARSQLSAVYLESFLNSRLDLALSVSTNIHPCCQAGQKLIHSPPHPFPPDLAFHRMTVTEIKATKCIAVTRNTCQSAAYSTVARPRVISRGCPRREGDLLPPPSPTFFTPSSPSWPRILRGQSERRVASHRVATAAKLLRLVLNLCTFCVNLQSLRLGFVN